MLCDGLSLFLGSVMLRCQLLCLCCCSPGHRCPGRLFRCPLGFFIMHTAPSGHTRECTWGCVPGHGRCGGDCACPLLLAQLSPLSELGRQSSYIFLRQRAPVLNGQFSLTQSNPRESNRKFLFISNRVELSLMGKVL